MANAHFDFVIEQIPPALAQTIMTYIETVAKWHDLTIGGGYLMVEPEAEVCDEQDA
jgi:hypothetical protein